MKRVLFITSVLVTSSRWNKKKSASSYSFHCTEVNIPVTRRGILISTRCRFSIARHGGLNRSYVLSSTTREQPETHFVLLAPFPVVQNFLRRDLHTQTISNSKVKCNPPHVTVGDLQSSIMNSNEDTLTPKSIYHQNAWGDQICHLYYFNQRPTYKRRIAFYTSVDNACRQAKTSDTVVVLSVVVDRINCSICPVNDCIPYS